VTVPVTVIMITDDDHDDRSAGLAAGLTVQHCFNFKLKE
jgi:hypothetical protein